VAAQGVSPTPTGLIDAKLQCDPHPQGGTEGGAEAEVARWIADFVAKGPGIMPDLAMRVLSAGVERLRPNRRAA
jgi:hypothetical protein